MEKYKVCPYCGKHNPPKMLECVECETDLSNISVVDSETEQKNREKETAGGAEPMPEMVRICDCGTHNPVSSRKCVNCGEDISDVIPETEGAGAEKQTRYVLAALEGEYVYEVTERAVVGREAGMQEYLSSKPYVSRRHAELWAENGHLFVKNLSQTNYTFVNNQKIPEGDCEVHEGDEVGLGGNIQNGRRQEAAAYFQVRTGSCI